MNPKITVCEETTPKRTKYTLGSLVCYIETRGEKFEASAFMNNGETASRSFGRNTCAKVFARRDAAERAVEVWLLQMSLDYPPAKGFVSVLALTKLASVTGLRADVRQRDENGALRYPDQQPEPVITRLTSVAVEVENRQNWVCLRYEASGCNFSGMAFSCEQLTEWHIELL